ncbi:hypothetical protein AAC387_Pa01g0644 [Persea americana]
MLRSCLRSSICSNRWAASTKPYFAWPPPNPLLHISKHLSSESSRQKNPQLPPLSDLKSLCIEDRLKEAILEMGIQGLLVDFDGYDSLLAVCINQNAVREGQRVHSHMIKTRYFPPVFLNTRLVIMYVKFGFLEDARRVFDGMSERNVVSWTAVISGCARRGRRYEALGLFLRMLETGIFPNEFTFASTLTACTGPGGLEHGIQLGLDEKALELFCQLQKEGMESNPVTYVSVLTALSGLAALDYGRQVHTQIIRSEVQSNVVLQNSLIDMYSKCGSLTYSRRVFNSMPGRTVISWNAMLVGYSKHGLGQQISSEGREVAF